ncbi:MAG: hypothetical protein ACRD44_12200, partial [Bryobacteraceae bacterium]
GGWSATRLSMIWAVTSYFNPCKYRRRLANYRVFRRQLQSPLVTVELSFDGQFQLQSGDADVLVDINGRDVMWQKERLLNVALGHLPAECDMVAWIDCDIVFSNSEWPTAARDALDRHAVVQLFDTIEYVAQNDEDDPEESVESVCKALASGRVSPEVAGAQDIRLFRVRTGGAWAARRELMHRHGLYDACILGSGDRAFLGALLGSFPAVIRYILMNGPRAEHYLRWAEPLHDAVRGHVGFCPGTVRHLWHGDRANRRYQGRHVDFARYDFDPGVDIAIDNGGWRWNSDKPEMHQFVRDYFSARMEDGSEGSPGGGHAP